MQVLGTMDCTLSLPNLKIWFSGRQVFTFLLFLLVLTLSFVFPPVCNAGNVTLVWQPNSQGNQPKGYRVYYGNKSRSYSKVIDAMNNTSCQLSELQPGTYYAAITAYNDLGESAYSEEASFVVDDASSYSSFIEVGDVTINHVWKKVYFKNVFNDPVVVAQCPSYNGPDPMVIRIRNIDKSGFEIRGQEWGYEDQWHTEETAGYVVVEKGEYLLPDGTMLKTGRFSTNKTGSFADVSFNSSFNSVPVIITAVTSYNGADTVTSRIKDLSRYGFRFCMQEQEANVQEHVTEQISYVALEPSSGTLGNLHFAVVNNPDNIDHRFTRVSFPQQFPGIPVIFAAMQTFNGPNTASLRWDNKDEYGFEIKVEEEQSLDSEISHVPEGIGYMVFFVSDN